MYDRVATDSRIALWWREAEEAKGRATRAVPVATEEVSLGAQVASPGTTALAAAGPGARKVREDQAGPVVGCALIPEELESEDGVAMEVVAAGKATAPRRG